MALHPIYYSMVRSPGGTSEVDPPVPIPNTEVKRFSADDTALVTVWENRSLPGGLSTIPRSSSSQTFPQIRSCKIMEERRRNTAKPNLGSALHRFCLVLQYSQHHQRSQRREETLVSPKPRGKLPFNHARTCSIIPPGLILLGMVVPENARICRKSP